MSRRTYLVILCIIISILAFPERSISTPEGDNILISEVLYDAPSSDATEEWIELFNPTGNDIQVDGWTISDNVGSFILSGIIPSGGYLVIARDATGFQSLYGFAPDLVMGGALALSNSGDQVSLKDDTSSEVDFVAWENYVAGWTINVVNEAIRRINEVDTDTVNDWESSNGVGDPGSGPYSAGGHVLISEVLYDAPTSDTTEEWIELYNPNSGAVDLTGWTISDNVGSFGLSGSIAGKGFLVIARDSNGFQSLYGFAPDLVMGGALALSNSGDQVSLTDASSTEVDFVAWENYVAGWTVSAVDTSIHRITATDTDTVSDWGDSGSIGEPGTANFGGGGAPDTTPPSVTILSPINGALLYGTISISFTSSDASPIVANEIYIDTNLVATTTSYSWDTTLYTDGNHDITARSQDEAGNWGEDNIIVSVDNTNPPPPTSEVKLMSYNVEASGANIDWKQVVKEENPDIAIFVETGTWDDNNNALLDQYCNEFNTYFTGIGEDPYSCVGTTGISFSTSGEAIFSRFPIIATNQLPSVILDDSSSFSVSHDFLHATILINSQEVNVIASHLKCCSGPDNELKRENAQQGIINYIDTLGNEPVIYAGDLNSFSPEDTYNLGDLNYGPMSMMLKDDTYGSYSQYGSVITDFYDVHTTLNPGVEAPTYGHQNPIYNSRIDFITVSTHLLPKLISSTTGDTPTANTGSDHYSVDVIIDFGEGGDTTPPSQVTGLIASPISETQIDLSWTANAEPDLDHYNVYRDGGFITSTTSNSFSDTGLNPSTVYSYSISAVDTSNNEGVQSNPVNAMTLDPPSGGLNHVIISEVYYDATGRDNQREWIELYNPTNQAVDLSGWYLTDDSGIQFILSGIINPGEFIVIARDLDGFNSFYGFQADLGSFGFNLNNNGDTLSLFNAQNAEIDFVSWEGNTQGWDISASTGSSIARSDLTVDTDTVADWVVVPNQGTPGTS